MVWVGAGISQIVRNMPPPTSNRITRTNISLEKFFINVCGVTPLKLSLSLTETGYVYVMRRNVNCKLCQYFVTAPVVILPASLEPFNEGPTQTRTFRVVGSERVTNDQKVLVFIGLMGAGKTSIGQKLAAHLNIGFVDADEEIVKAAGCSIPDIFESYGEPAFRDVEERVIKRLLTERTGIMATGGGAYINQKIRDAITQHGYCIWLKASLDILVKRTAKRTGRPLLESGEPREILRDLMDKRYPVYARADLTVETGAKTVDQTLHAILDSLKQQTPMTGDSKNE